MRIISGILFVAITAGSTIAAPLKVANANATLAKRDYENTQWTWSDTRLGACGEVNTPDQFVCVFMPFDGMSTDILLTVYLVVRRAKHRGQFQHLDRPGDFGLTVLK